MVKQVFGTMLDMLSQTHLKLLLHTLHPVYHNFLVNSYCVGLAGEEFSTAHGDLLTEILTLNMLGVT